MPAEDLIAVTLALPGGELSLLQPGDSAELPDDGGVEWAPLVPYWSVLWRSGVALARELSSEHLDGVRVVELGCGMGVPSMVASRSGAEVMATDEIAEALELLAVNADRNDIELHTMRVDWAAPDHLLEQSPFDLVLAADVLYERPSVARLLELLPRLAPRVLLADPGRPAADAFLSEARRRWTVATRAEGVVNIHALTPAPR